MEDRDLEARLAQRLSDLRMRHGLTLDALAEQSGISRTTLSRLERNESSPGAGVLNRLCRVYGLTMSRLMADVEDMSPRVLPASGQAVWTDPSCGYVRRMLSPPATGYRAELLHGTLPPGASVAYDAPSVPGLEQHLWLMTGSLQLTLQASVLSLEAGDSLRFRVWGSSRFACTSSMPATYVLAVCLP